MTKPTALEKLTKEYGDVALGEEAGVPPEIVQQMKEKLYNPEKQGNEKTPVEVLTYSVIGI